LASKKEKEFLKQWSPTKKEELLLHNLQTKKYWFEKNKDTEGIASSKKKKTKPIPEKWEMLKGIQLYDWQKEAVESWFKEKKGIIKVVTGAGKTILALSIIEKLQEKEKGKNKGVYN
jgi:superfamily II DNA or RNA helicase